MINLKKASFMNIVALHSLFLRSFFILLGVLCNAQIPTKMKMEESVNFSCNINTGDCFDNHTIKVNNTSDKIPILKPTLKIRYYYDALCGWCYGFSPVINRLKETYQNKIDIDVISGGLFLGNRAGYVNNVAPHIRAGAYKSVEAIAQVKFGKPFLDDVFNEGKMVLNSLPPTIALCIIREKYPEKELEFAATLLKAVYFDGINPVDTDAYLAYVLKYGINKDEFITKMNDQYYKQMAFNEFNTFKKSQYSGMPSIVVVKDGKEIPLSKGFINYNQLEAKINQFID